jgi:hypothetical protein
MMSLFILIPYNSVMVELKESGGGGILLCSYCDHLRGIEHGIYLGSDDVFCWNTESPNYNGITKPLKEEQLKIGCDKIGYNGEKIPAHLLELIPEDSILRKLPKEEVLSDYALYLIKEKGAS